MSTVRRYRTNSNGVPVVHSAFDIRQQPCQVGAGVRTRDLVLHSLGNTSDVACVAARVLPYPTGYRTLVLPYRVLLRIVSVWQHMVHVATVRLLV